MSMYVVGHKIPDSDSICGAIALAYLKNQIDEPAIPTRLGDVSPETQFILDRFGFEAPELKLSYAGEDVYIVDQIVRQFFKPETIVYRSVGQEHESINLYDEPQVKELLIG